MENAADDPSQALGAQADAASNASTEKTKKPIILCANPDCKIEFERKRKTQRFCSVKCRNDEFWSRHKRLTVPLRPEQTTSTQQPS